jgi:hypothetical protein
MAWRFNAPPGWPPPPPGWTPPPDWNPDPSWPPPPPGWQFWVADGEPPPPGPRRRSRAGPIAAIVAILVIGVVGLVVVAGVFAVQRFTGETDTKLLETSSDATAVRIGNGCGSVQVLPGAPGVVRTSARVTSWWSTPRVTSRDDGGEVVVDVQCRSFGGSVSLVVEVPGATRVQARSSAGQVEASGLTGPLTLHSSAGSVTGENLGSAEVAADSSAGSVSLRWAADADPQRVDASSSAGSVTVLVPDRPGRAYRVDADSSAGSTTVEVRSDPAAARTIRAHSSAGSVTVAYG